MAKSKRRIKQGMHLTEDQRRVLRKKLQEKLGSAREIAQAINDATKGSARTLHNTPLKENQVYFYLSYRGASKPRALSPSIAKAMYELCDRDPSLIFLKECSDLCYMEIDVGLATRKVKERFDSLKEAKDYGNEVLYRTMRGLLDETYQSQKSEEHRREFLGELEGLLKRFSEE